MKKRIIALLFVFAAAVCAVSCAGVRVNRSVVINYYGLSSFLACGDHFVTQGEKSNEIYIFSDKPGEKPYIFSENAVYVCENEHHGGYFLVGADSESFYYLKQSFSYTNYGVGSGSRVYRYNLNGGKAKLVYKEIPLTNFDAFLGLEDIFGFQGPASGENGLSDVLRIYVDGKFSLTKNDVLSFLKAENERQKADIKLSDFGFTYCVSGGRIFFKDVFDNLYCYNTEVNSFTSLPYYGIRFYFVTESNLFVLQSENSDLIACDLDGNLIKTIELNGAVINSLNCFRIENGNIYLMDSIGTVWVIDKTLGIAGTYILAPEVGWTVKDGNVYYYNAESKTVVMAEKTETTDC